MSDQPESQDALSRLQAALERIASRALTPGHEIPPPAPEPRLGEVAERLDRVIARLRNALAEG